MNKVLDLKLVQEAVDELVDFVKPTYGPAGNKVILSDGKMLAVLDDGVSIADQYHSYDQAKDVIMTLVKEVAKRTNKRVGDGTTGSLILTQALVKGLEETTDIGALQTAKEEAVALLKEKIKHIKSEAELADVAYMAYRNKDLSRLVAQVVYKLGAEAVVSLEESANLETTCEFADGIQFERGFLSPYMVTDRERMEAVWEDTPVLLTDRKIESIHELVPLCEQLAKQGAKHLVVIAEDFLGDTLPTIVSNLVNKKFGILAVRAPGFAHRMRDLLDDMAVVLGGEVVGRELEAPNFAQALLGRAKKVVAGRERTIIIEEARDVALVTERIESLKRELENQPTDFDKARVQERIARLSTGVAIIKVGASTESETKAIKFKIEDALNAAKAALKGGVVLGGGKTLSGLVTSSPLLNEALKAPEATLVENGGVLEEVYDPVDVLIASLESAVSIVVLLKEAKGIITTT